MGRLTFALVVALIWVGFAGSAYAQVPVSGYGGFGMEYTQAMPANSYVLDRWWLVRPTPAVVSAMPPQSVVTQPATVQQPQPANPRRAARVARRSIARGTAPASYGTAGLQQGTPLPTGSLYWGAPAAGMPIYSPAQRYAAYGQGYGVSPYGTADYNALYKGYYWGGY